MASTEYTYRVRAIHGMTASSWSTAAMETTGPAVMPVLTAPSNVMADHTGPEVTITWEGGENADTFAVAMIRRDADGNWDISNAVYDTRTVTGSPHIVNMASPAGRYLPCLRDRRLRCRWMVQLGHQFAGLRTLVRPSELE